MESDIPFEIPETNWELTYEERNMATFPSNTSWQLTYEDIKNLPETGPEIENR